MSSGEKLKCKTYGNVFMKYLAISGHAVALVVEALCYKPEARWLNS
jgi:hypothetical protein